MQKKKFLFFAISLVCCSLLIVKPLRTFLDCYSIYTTYPNFQNNPYLTNQQRSLMVEHLLPLDHPLKTQLDRLFTRSRVTHNEEALKNAGFSIIASMPGSFVIVARHQELPGYVLKLYLDSETRTKEGIPNCVWLAKRCIGAKIIREVINKKKLKHFTVPDKWLYILPPTPLATGPIPQPVLVIETDMKLVDELESKHAWQTVITPEHLNELHTIIKHGYGSIRVAENIPYTKQGTFAFTDTEYPKRKLKMKRVSPYLSEELQPYWKQISQ